MVYLHWTRTYESFVENAAHNCSFAMVTSLPAHRIWCLHGIYGIHKIIIKLTLHRIEAIKLLSIVHAIQKFISRLSLHTYNAWLMEYQWAHHGYGLKCATASNSNSQLLLLPRLLLSLHSYTAEKREEFWPRGNNTTDVPRQVSWPIAPQRLCIDPFVFKRF